MLRDRLRTLTRAFNAAGNNNAVYEEAQKKVSLFESQLDFIAGLQAQLHIFDAEVVKQEEEWRRGVLSVLEAEVMDALSYVYPTDGYKVELDSKILRGKIHIDATVSSIFTGGMPGSITGTQGRLFQQVVSSSSLVAVMGLLGVKTIYIDEAFSCSSKRNIKVLNSWLQSLKDRGFNLVMIVQDTSIADGLDANRMFLSRSLDNKTIIHQEERHNGRERESGIIEADGGT